MVAATSGADPKAPPIGLSRAAKFGNLYAQPLVLGSNSLMTNSQNLAAIPSAEGVVLCALAFSRREPPSYPHKCPVAGATAR